MSSVSLRAWELVASGARLVIDIELFRIKNVRELEDESRKHRLGRERIIALPHDNSCECRLRHRFNNGLRRIFARTFGDANERAQVPTFMVSHSALAEVEFNTPSGHLEDGIDGQLKAG